MTEKKILFSGFLLFVLCIPFSSFGGPAPMKWGKLSDKEKAFTECSFDREANAVILCEFGKLEVRNGTEVFTKHVRIKILNQQGISQSDIRIPFYAKDGIEKLTRVKAQTLNVDEHGRLVKHKVEKDQFYEVDRPNEWKECRFNFPAVKEGSIIEYEYTTISENIVFLEGWLFQHEIPTLHSELLALIPKGLDYMSLAQGPRLLKQLKDNLTNQWVLKNLPALKEEPFSNNYYDYAEKIRFQLAGYRSAGGAYSSSEYVDLMRTWEGLSEELLQNHAFSRYLNRNNKVREMVAALTDTIKDDLDKAHALYKYIIRELAWNGKFRIFSDQSINSLLSAKKGNSAEINLFLTLLLKEAGFDAHPVLLSTVQHGRIAKAYPLLSQFNHIICHVSVHGEEYLLDATNRYVPFDLLPAYDLSGTGYLLSDDNPHWIKINPPSNTSVFSFAAVDLEKEIPEMKVDIKFDGYVAKQMREKLVVEDEDDFLYEDFLQNINRFSIEDVSIRNEKTVDEPLEVHCLFSWRDNAGVKTDMIYLKPFLNNGVGEHPFKTEKRYLPIDYRFPFNFHSSVQIKLPEGYTVEELPDNQALKLPDNFGSFTYQVKHANGYLQIVSSFAIVRHNIPVYYYPALQEFYKLMIAQYNEPVVLKKI